VAADRPAVQRLAAMPPAAPVAPENPVYELPDFVFFGHGRHVSKGVTCAACHGDVWGMERVQPVLRMKMAACVDCHTANRASVTCTVCHELTQ
jgi:hypothetical protein